MILRSQNQQFFFKDQRGLPNLIYRTPHNYICGLTMIIEYGSKDEDTYFKVSMSIVGFFVLRKEEIEIKNNLDIDMFLKTQPLAILSPYLRASLTSFLISAGVTQFVFPLINMKKLAEQHLADKKIIEV